jgi:alkanesulfonate monooxygenase SsuD/methylene tetrahydromethanopterin reductase-like flavin-dependent oxidoreductase (luciferase family)
VVVNDGLRWGFAVNTFFSESLDARAEIREILALGPLSEQAGFDSVWIGDHVLWHTPIADTLSVLAAYAATTGRVQLGTAILLLGLRQPVLAAKALTTLGLMSDDRLVVGVGVGGENPREFAAAGVDHSARGRLLDDALRVLVDQWRPDRDTPKVAPIGAQPPLYIGGSSAATRRRIAEFDAGWIGAWVSPRRIREESAILAEARGGTVPIALNIYLCTDSDGDAARERASSFLAESYSADPAPLMRHSVAGTPAECAEVLAEYVAAGVGHMILRPAWWDQRAQLTHWGDELVELLTQIPSGAGG